MYIEHIAMYVQDMEGKAVYKEYIFRAAIP